MSLDQCAPWRSDKDLAKGDLTPVIHDKSVFNPIKHLYGSSVRFFLATSDVEYLMKYIDRLSCYEASSSNIPYLIGIYSSLADESSTSERLRKLKTDMQLQKVTFFVFTSAVLDKILSTQDSAESSWDYKINYIRNARYNILPVLWNNFGVNAFSHAISDSSAYIVDLDNLIYGDINHSIKKLYGSKKMIFSWNSGQTNNKNFPNNFTGLTVNGQRYHHDFLYTIVKAGFSVFSPCPQSNIFLSLFKNYTIGLTNTNVSRRLFSFYFSDQLAIILSLIDLKNSDLGVFMNSIGWIDLHQSTIASLDKENSPLMFCPKGLDN